MLKIKFTSNGYVGMSIYATNITLDGVEILPSAYLAQSMVTIISDNDKGQDGPIDVEALVPTWLVEAKIRAHKAEQQEADQETVKSILALASTN